MAEAVQTGGKTGTQIVPRTTRTEYRRRLIEEEPIMIEIDLMTIKIADQRAETEAIHHTETDPQVADGPVRRS